MALLHEAYTPPADEEVKQSDPEIESRIREALMSLGGEMVRSTCSLIDTTRARREGGTKIIIPIYHPQHDLPPYHQIAVWSELDMGANVTYFQRVVRRMSDRHAIALTEPRAIAIRPQGDGGAEIPGLDPAVAGEEGLTLVRDTHETVAYAAMANGLNPRQIDY